MSFKKLTAAALSLLALGTPIKQLQAAQQRGVQINKEVVQNNQQTKKRKDSLPDMVGGHEIVNIGGYGIPPHVYGMNYVRRGTHKRTNK